MSEDQQQPEIVHSELSQDILVEGHRFRVNIFGADDGPGWLLEVVDEQGGSHFWDLAFETERQALDAAVLAFDEEGKDGFLKPPSNVIAFPQRFTSD